MEPSMKTLLIENQNTPTPETLRKNLIRVTSPDAVVKVQGIEEVFTLLNRVNFDIIILCSEEGPEKLIDCVASVSWNPFYRGLSFRNELGEFTFYSPVSFNEYCANAPKNSVIRVCV
jgi:hypothetical protein